MLVVLPIHMNAAAKDYYMCMRLGRGPIDNKQVQYRAQSGQEFTIYTVNWRSPLGLTACQFCNAYAAGACILGKASLSCHENPESH